MGRRGKRSSVTTRSNCKCCHDFKYVENIIERGNIDSDIQNRNKAKNKNGIDSV